MMKKRKNTKEKGQKKLKEEQIFEEVNIDYEEDD